MKRTRIGMALALLVATGHLDASNLKPLAKATLTKTVAETTELGNLRSQIQVLSEAGSSLRSVDDSTCRKLFDQIFQGIASSDRDVRKSGESDREQLFQEFIRVVSRYDGNLSLEYVRRFRREFPNVNSPVILWDAAYDGVTTDTQNSIRLAESAVANTRSLFPEKGFLFLETLRGLNSALADALASELVVHAKGLSTNSRLLLLSYVLAYSRIPEFLSGSIYDREIAQRPAPGTPPLSSTLLRQFTTLIIRSPDSSPTAQFVVLSLLDRNRKALGTDLSALLTSRKTAVAGAIGDIEAARLSSEIERWTKGGDILSESAKNAESRFQETRDEKYRTRASLMRALALARSTDVHGAMSLLSEIPVDERRSATDAVLLYAANAAKERDFANNLVGIARSETHNHFVVAFCLLTAAKLSINEKRRVDSLAQLAEIDQLVAQISNASEDYSLRLGVTYLLSKLDQERALSHFSSLVATVNQENLPGKTPEVHLVLRISGTVMEFNIPAGNATLFGVARELAKLDLQSTLNVVAVANPAELRLRLLAAACSEYLEKNSRPVGGRAK